MLMEALIWSVLLGTAAGFSVHGLLPWWTAVTDDYLLWRGERLHALQLPKEVIQFGLALWAVALVVVVVGLAAFLHMWPIACVAGWLMYRSPRWLVSELIRRREQTLRDQIVPACFSLACGVQAGLSLPVAMDRAAKDTPQPLQAHLQRIVHLYQRGTPLRESLDAVSQSLNLEIFALVSTAIGVTLERGGNVDEALSRISRSVQEEQRLEGRLRALTAGPRTAIATLAAFPVVFLAGFAFFDRYAVGKLFSTFEGQIAFCTGALATYIAVRWAYAILRSVV